MATSSACCQDWRRSDSLTGMAGFVSFQVTQCLRPPPPLSSPNGALQLTSAAQTRETPAPNLGVESPNGTRVVSGLRAWASPLTLCTWGGLCRAAP